jgi:hypothetical protein
LSAPPVLIKGLAKNTKVRKAYVARDRKKIKKFCQKGLTNLGKLDTLVNARLKQSESEAKQTTLEPRQNNSLKAKQKKPRLEAIL